MFNPINDGGDKITPDINPKCGQMPCPDNSEKIGHLYVSLMVLEIIYLTLFMRVGIK